MSKIYLSPSNQTGNKFITGNTSEGAVWNDIAKRLAEKLKDYECEVLLCKSSQTLAARAAEAAAWGADVYIAMHSNAAGTANKGARGVEVYYDPAKGEKTKKLAQTLLDQLGTLFTKRGLRTSSKLIDCYKPSMPSVIGECGFHDNTQDAKLILNNRDKIAELYLAALVSYLKLKKKETEPAPAPAPAPDPEKRVLKLPAGTKIRLDSCPLYVSSTAKTKRGTKTGIFFVWGSAVVAGRIRVTISPRLVGKAGQVTGWIDPKDVTYALHQVAKGDTLGKIAKTYGTTVDRIYSANRDAFPAMTKDLIRVGWELKIV